jgi:hypothetical protein
VPVGTQLGWTAVTGWQGVVLPIVCVSASLTLHGTACIAAALCSSFNFRLSSHQNTKLTYCVV